MSKLKPNLNLNSIHYRTLSITFDIALTGLSASLSGDDVLVFVTNGLKTFNLNTLSSVFGLSRPTQSNFTYTGLIIFITYFLLLNFT